MCNSRAVATAAARRPPPVATQPRGSAFVRSITGHVDEGVRKANEHLRASKPPAFWRQVVYFGKRSFIAQSRIMVSLGTDLFLVCAVGAILGLVYFDSDDEGDLLQTVSLSCLAVGMTAIMHSMRYFSKELDVFHREQQVGLSLSAYFLAKVLTHLPMIILSPAVYLSFYYTFASPRSSLSDYYRILLLVELVGTGVGYCVPLLFKGRAQLVGVVFPLVCTMFGGTSPSLVELEDNLVRRSRRPATPVVPRSHPCALVASRSPPTSCSPCRTVGGRRSCCSWPTSSR